MNSNTLSVQKSRFETRLTINQKVAFERAATLGGYRSLSDFVVSAVQEKARKIIEEHETVLASEKDSQIFFNAVINAENPGKELVKAAKRYNELLAE